MYACQALPRGKRICWKAWLWHREVKPWHCRRPLTRTGYKAKPSTLYTSILPGRKDPKKPINIYKLSWNTRIGSHKTGRTKSVLSRNARSWESPFQNMIKDFAAMWHGHLELVVAGEDQIDLSKPGKKTINQKIRTRIVLAHSTAS